MSTILRPLSGDGRGRRLLPFAFAIIAGQAFLLFDGADGTSPGSRLAALALTAAVVTSVEIVPWRRLPASLEAAPGFLVLLVVALIIVSSGARSSYAPLVLLPLLWFSVYATRLALAGAIALSDAILLVNVLTSTSRVEAGEVRAAVLWTIVVTIVPWVLHRYVGDLRHRAALADRDFITDLYSRRAWEERLPDELVRAERDDKPLCIVLLDLDRFKQFNDLHGHQAGDQLLRQTALAWAESLRSTDLLARFGGDEYCALLPGCAADDARSRVDRLLAASASTAPASAGVAEWIRGETPARFIQRADRALYDAKAAGGGRAVVSSVDRAAEQ